MSAHANPKPIAAATVEQHDRLVAARFAAIAKEIARRHDRADDPSGAAESFELARALPGGWIRPSIRPSLHDWTTTAEQLLINGAYERYPDAHALRHGRELGRIAFAGLAAGGPPASGSVALLGRRSIALLAETWLLESIDHPDVAWAEWRFDGRSIELDGIGQIDLARPEHSTCAQGWRVRIAQRVGECVVSGDGSESRAKALRCAFDHLSDLERATVLHAIRRVAPHDDRDHWVAGVARIEPTDTECTARDLLAAAEEDVARRRRDLERGRSLENITEPDTGCPGAAPVRIDWSPVDALIGSTGSPGSTPTDLVAHAYHGGDFVGCIQLARHVLAGATDQAMSADDKERAWYLLAFAARHLGDRRTFDDVVFGGCRDVEVVGRPRSASPIEDADWADARITPVATTRSWSGLLSELVQAKGSELQITSYVAVMHGLRPALDDWIPPERMVKFLGLMDRLGLAVEADCVFRRLDRNDPVAPAAVIPTTQARVFHLSDMSEPNSSTVHVFVGASRDAAGAAFRAGWYGAAVRDRFVHKPRIDHRRFGNALGYPTCCVDRFLEVNDWPRFNAVAEADKRSVRRRWETNPLTKHTPYIGSFHVPCSFDCEATTQATRAQLRVVGEHDSSFAEEIGAALRQTYLTINESTSYVLAEGTAGVRGVGYAQFRYVGGKLEMDALSGPLSVGNRLRLEHGTVFIQRDDHVLDVIDISCADGRMDIPLVLDFGDDPHSLGGER